MNKNDGKIKNNLSFDVVKVKTESKFGTLKTIIVVSLIVLQFVFLLFFGLYLYNIFKWLIAISFVITFIFCVSTLSSKRTGQTKATWIFFMLICVTFGWIIFLLSSNKFMFSRSKKRYQKIYNKSNLIQQSDTNLENLPISVQNDCTYFKNYGKFPIYTDSQTKYYPNGTALFDDILEDLEKAEKFIFMEYYIISDGVLLSRILDILTRKAQSGVDVRIIYDDMGSHGTLSRRRKKQIKKMGIRLQTFNKLWPIFDLALNIRDHRKIVVIDGKVAYTGGANLADEYINERRTHGYWKDCGIKITGNAVNTFTLAILRQWEFLTKEEQDYEQFLTTNTNFSSAPENICVPYVSGPDYKSNIARDIYENIIASANEKIYIMTPYLVPDETLLNLLKNKAQSGVDVHIVLPEVADKKFVYLITLDTAEALMEYGVKVHLMKNSFVHSKLVLTENSCVVGTINMDQRSLYQQFESAVYTNDKQVMKNLTSDFNLTFERSVLHSKKRNSFLRSVLIHILRLIAPLM